MEKKVEEQEEKVKDNNVVEMEKEKEKLILVKEEDGCGWSKKSLYRKLR